MDWTQYTQDPNDAAVRLKMEAHLVSIRQTASEDLGDFLSKQVKGKTVLDIGVCEHTISYIDSPHWRHRKLKQQAARIVGVDILSSLAKQLNEIGYDVRELDATSDADLGERFERVICGDVIEHVENPVRLLRFASLHLGAGGEILVSTPNPFFEEWKQDLHVGGTYVSNFEHLYWFSPSHALELARRAGLSLKRYYAFAPALPRRNFLKRWYLESKPLEVRARYFIYVFCART